MSYVRKRYRIEQTLAAQDGIRVPAEGDHRIGEILTTVQDLWRFLDPAQRMAAEVVESYRREIGEVYELKAELDPPGRRRA